MLEFSKTEKDTLINSGWSRPKNWHFSRHLSAIALTPNEIGIASHFFPIVFSKQNYGWRAFAVFCLDNELNRFVHPISGDWLAGYAPVFLRSAPFMLHTGADNALQFWPGLGPEPLSDELEPFLVNGKPTEKLVNILNILKNAHYSMQKIDHALSQLEKCGGLVRWVVEDAVEPNIKLMGNEVWVLCPEYLNNMKDDLILTLHKQKALGWLYAHEHSLTNIYRLLTQINTDIDFNFEENLTSKPNSYSQNNFPVEHFLNNVFKDETSGEGI
jgi:hypothetical protein